MQLHAVTSFAPNPPPELAGVPDGPEMVLPSGVRLQRQWIGSNHVSDEHLRQAVRGVLKLPMSHQRLFATLGFPIELVPVAFLEQVAGTTNPVVGATRVLGPDGSARPDRMRIATYQELVGTQVEEAIQHEIGHALNVVTRQDLSEDAANAYAARY
ncbi:MAG: hypothetical protein JWL76_661 [Thermoleophilia bacterium]|nr:hypothetical protein [Thermoleophilia bacterium]